MASFGDVAKALGFSILSGFGTAEDQRERSLRERQLAEQTAWRQQQAEESKRLHDLQYGFAGPDELALYEPMLKELGVVMPQGARLRRPDIPRLLEHGVRARAEQPIDITQAAEVAGVPFPPTQETIPGQMPGEFGALGEVPEEMPVTVQRSPKPMLVPKCLFIY